MNVVEIDVHITGYTFSIGQIQAFLDTARSVDAILDDAEIYIECEHTAGRGDVLHTLRATTASKQ